MQMPARRLYVLRNESSGVALAARVVRASDPFARGIGLLNRSAVSSDEGLWISNCSAVHTLGMRATIDLYFLDRNGRVTKIASAIPPHRLSISCREAHSVVELGAADCARAVRLGDKLVLE